MKKLDKIRIVGGGIYKDADFIGENITPKKRDKMKHIQLR